jgi:hypothetical protein
MPRNFSLSCLSKTQKFRPLWQLCGLVILALFLLVYGLLSATGTACMTFFFLLYNLLKTQPFPARPTNSPSSSDLVDLFLSSMCPLLQLSCSPKENMCVSPSTPLYLTFSHLSALNCVPSSASKAPRRCVPLDLGPTRH